MNELEGTIHLATSVSRGLEKLEMSAKSHPRHRIAKMLIRHLVPIKANFKTAFRASSASTSAAGGKFLPIIYEGDCIPSEHLHEDDIRVKLGQYYPQFRLSLQNARMLLDSITRILEKPAADNESRDPTPRIPLGLGSVGVCWVFLRLTSLSGSYWI